jgi:hypothetical protein
VITLVALLGLTVAVAAAPTAGAQQDGQGKLTFTLGMANDIDSMNRSWAIWPSRKRSGGRSTTS